MTEKRSDVSSHNMQTFRQALLNALETRKISLRSVAEGSGVSYEQLKKLKQVEGRSTNVDDAMRIAAFFDQTLDDFIQGEIPSKSSEIAALLVQLTPEEERFLLNAAKAQIAARATDNEEAPEDVE